MIEQSNKEIVAYHEGGHALVALYTPGEHVARRGAGKVLYIRMSVLGVQLLLECVLCWLSAHYGSNLSLHFSKVLFQSTRPPLYHEEVHLEWCVCACVCACVHACVRACVCACVYTPHLSHV